MLRIATLVAAAALSATTLLGAAPGLVRAAGGAVAEFPIPTRNPGALQIATGSDGALWFTESAVNQIGRITTSGSFNEYQVPTAPLNAGGSPFGIAAGPDGALWFTEPDRAQIGRITTDGAFTEYPVPTPGSEPNWIAAGSDGALWFTERAANQIGRIATDGAVTEYPIPLPGANPGWITLGPDDALWFTGLGVSYIGRISTSTSRPSEPPGTFREFNLSGASASGIAAGPDGALWFVLAEGNGESIVRMDVNGSVTGVFSVPTASSDSLYIAPGPDGAMWFTERVADKIGRVSLTAGPTYGTITECPVPYAGPHGIVAGPDGGVWFAELDSWKIGRIDPAGCASATAITSDLSNASAVGESYTVTGTVSAAVSGQTSPTGSVAVSDGSATCSASLSSGAFNCSLTSTTAGTKTITATYPGDANFAGSSATASHPVELAAVLTYTGTTSSKPGAAITLRATLTTPTTSGGSAPIANRKVTFTLNGTPYTVTTNNSGVASTGATAPSTADTYPISVSFVGDATYGPASTSASLADRSSTVLMYTGSTSALAGASIALSATLKTTGVLTPIANRNLTFTLDGTAYTAATDESGTATAGTVAPSTAGSFTIAVSFAGDAAYVASSRQATLKVKIGTVVTYTGPTTAVHGTSTTLSATLTASDGSALSGKTLRFTIDGKGYNAVTNVSGMASRSVPMPKTPGSYAITTAFAGDANDAASSTVLSGFSVT